MKGRVAEKAGETEESHPASLPKSLRRAALSKAESQGLPGVQDPKALGCLPRVVQALLAGLAMSAVVTVSGVPQQNAFGCITVCWMQRSGGICSCQLRYSVEVFFWLFIGR